MCIYFLELEPENCFGLCQLIYPIWIQANHTMVCVALNTHGWEVSVRAKQINKFRVFHSLLSSCFL